MIKKKFGVRFAKFLISLEFSPDFIVHDQFREACVAHTLDFVFNTLRCQIAHLTLPIDSPNLHVLKKACKASKVHFWITKSMGHRILPIHSTWAEFKKSGGKKSRQEFRNIEKKMNRAGSWKIVHIENKDKAIGVFKRILDVERVSWKARWRAQRGEKMDSVLLFIWEGAQQTAKTVPNFRWNVYFLELNNQTIAYTLVLQYKDVAIVAKTSYDSRQKKLYPGKYVINATIRSLFNRGDVRVIDFMTDLAFLRTWTYTRMSRVELPMTQRGFTPIVLSFALANKHLRKTRLAILLDLLSPRLNG